MYLSRRAADMLGHTLSVQSAPGAGSTFSLDMKESNLQVERPYKNVSSAFHFVR